MHATPKFGIVDFRDLYLPFTEGLWYTCVMKYFKSIAARLICLFVLAFAGYSRADDVYIYADELERMGVATIVDTL